MINFSRFSIERVTNPYYLMAILLFFWGSFSAVCKLTLADMDGFQVLFYMFGFSVLIMSVYLPFSGKINEMSNISCREYLKLLLIGIPQFLYYFCFIMALKWIPVMEASMLNYLYPVFVVLLAVPINGERLDRKKIASILVSFLGVYIIITKGNILNFSLSNSYGDAMIIAGSASWGFFTNFGRKNKIDSFISNYIYTVMAFLLSSISVFCYSDLKMPGYIGVVGSLWISVSCILATYIIWFRVLKIASPILVANLAFITPFITIIFIMLLLGESILLVQFLGLLIIIFGTALQNDRVIMGFKQLRPSKLID